ncbi:hypothetical protein RvVAT039_41270 [Agrobacterium vitis]|nr:hypothetical protein RvVAT039_41270 [Agrobacterium vitis]
MAASAKPIFLNDQDPQSVGINLPPPLVEMVNAPSFKLPSSTKAFVRVSISFEKTVNKE